MAQKPSRAAQGAGSIRKREDGRWEGRYTLGRDLGTGKPIRKSVYGKTQGEVRKKLQQITVTIDEGTYTEPSKLTVGQWLDIWVSEYLVDVKPHTLKSYKEHVKNHLKPNLGLAKLSVLAAHEIQALYNRLMEKLSPKTIRNIHGVLHKALSQAVELGYIKHNPSDACKLPRVIKPEIKPLDDEQISDFLQAIKGHPDERLFIVDLFTGMRQGEILGLKWDCVDFDSGSILINKQLQKVNGEYCLMSVKNDKARRINPAPAVMRALLEQRRVQMEWKFKAGKEWENSGLVFTNKSGGNLTFVTAYRHFKNIVKSIGIPNARFHDMRHSYAVAALQAGDDVKTVQENLGHHSASFTLDVYGHVTERMKRESANRMEDFIKSVSSI